MRVLGAIYRKHQNDVDKHCKINSSEETREGVGRNQSREEEPSTLVGVASIDRDDAPSAVSQLRNASVRTNLISKKRGLSKGIRTKRNKLSRFGQSIEVHVHYRDYAY
uniref:Ovule protein n=1 Tax=Loa loa TaxID=7209 RepID=A0A1I7VWL0_LOALO